MKYSKETTLQILEKMHWLFNKNSHASRVEDISIDLDKVSVTLDDDTTFEVDIIDDPVELLENICQGIH